MNCGESIRVMHPLFQEGQGGSIPTSPLQLRVEEIDVHRARELNFLWHSLLPRTHLGNLVGSKCAISYAAEYLGIIYAVAIWSDPIAANRLADGDSAIELRRMAIAPDAPKNTASRMLAIMAKLIKRRWATLNRLISYQAADVHNGTIYRAAGWTRGPESATKEWHPTESRASVQTSSKKIRWEKTI